MTQRTLKDLEVLLAEQHWEAALHAVWYLIRSVENREQSRRLWELLRGVEWPQWWPSERAWQVAWAWVLYRAGEIDALLDVLAGLEGGDDVVGLRAVAATERRDWAEVEQLWKAVVEGEAEPDVFSRAVLARYWAYAEAEQQRPDWPAAYAEAERLTWGKRDKGVVLVDFAHQLSRTGQDAQARAVLNRAGAHLGRDAVLLTLCYANLGMVCLNLDDLSGAEKALRSATEKAKDPAASRYRSTAWRGLGNVYLRKGHWARAEYAFEQAQQTAEDQRQHVAVARARARLARFQGDWDASCRMLNEALLELNLPTDTPHPIYADLAEGWVLQGDEAAARRDLELVQVGHPFDRFRVSLVQAELARRRGQSFSLPPERRDVWWREQTALFPEVLRDLPAFSPAPWAVTVRADGPLRLQDAALPVTIRANHAALRVLAYLIHCGNSASTERILEDVEISGASVRRQEQTLSRLVGQLREWLGWPGAIVSGGHTLRLAEGVEWRLIFPPVSRMETFCEGCFDRWVVEWKTEHYLRSLDAALKSDNHII